MRNFEWMKVYFSPFKPPKLKWYFGRVTVGVPYFYPRVWKKATSQKAIKEAVKEMNKVKKYNEETETYKLTVHSFNTLYERYKESSFAEPKKVGFDFVPMRWKTKWSDIDYRFETSPVWSFVFFGYQIAIIFVAVDMHHFWECWLYYNYNTEGTWKERVEKCRKEFPQTWTSHKDGKEAKINYYDKVLKNKYV